MCEVKRWGGDEEEELEGRGREGVAEGIMPTEWRAGEDMMRTRGLL